MSLKRFQQEEENHQQQIQDLIFSKRIEGRTYWFFRTRDNGDIGPYECSHGLIEKDIRTWYSIKH